MSWHDRPYAQSDYNSPPPHRSGGFAGGMPRPGRAVKYLLIINVAVFLVQIFLDRPSLEYTYGPMSGWGGVTVSGFWQIWRYVTFQFLHDSSRLWHIALNMLGLYMLGSSLEQHFGTKKFLVFYLSCGVVAGLAYIIIGAIFELDPNMPIVGASGGVYGIVLACAILFPHFQLILLFFPVPIRLAAILIFGGMILMVLQSLAGGHADADQAMSDVAHLGGAAAAAVWIWILPRIRMKLRFGDRPAGQGRWETKLKRRQEQQEKIDRILDKIRREGIGSLNRRERQLLQQTTEEMKND